MKFLLSLAVVFFSMSAFADFYSASPVRDARAHTEAYGQSISATSSRVHARCHPFFDDHLWVSKSVSCSAKIYERTRGGLHARTLTCNYSATTVLRNNNHLWYMNGDCP